MDPDQAGVGFRHQQYARCAPVKAVYQLQAGFIPVDMAQYVDDPGHQAAAAVNGDAAGLVDDQQLRVFIKDPRLDQGDEARRRRRFYRAGFQRDGRQAQGIPFPQAVIRFDAAAVNPDFPAPEHLVDARPGHAFEMGGQEIIDTAVGLSGFDGYMPHLVFFLFYPRHMGRF